MKVELLNSNCVVNLERRGTPRVDRETSRVERISLRRRVELLRSFQYAKSEEYEWFCRCEKPGERTCLNVCWLTDVKSEVEGILERA
jgi:hypothetical protein